MTQAWYPSLEDVAALLRARTKTRMGGEVGMFTADTRPTDIEVRRLMSFAAVDMAPCIGDPDTLPVKYHEPLSLVVAMKTAMLIELSYFPEQVAQDRSAYAEYETMHTYMKEALCSSIGDDPSVTGTSQDIPTGSFPDYGWVWINVGDVAGLVGNDGSIWTLNDVIRRLEGTGG
jgi:hypothetical protein